MAEDWLLHAALGHPSVITPASLHLVTGGEQAANSVVGDDPARLWLAPGRALVVGFGQAAAPEGDVVSDVTDGQAVFALANAEDMLAMATTLDPALLAPGRCAQTMFAGVKVLLWRRGGTVLLHVDRPLGHYIAAWLKQAATALEGVAQK